MNFTSCSALLAVLCVVLASGDPMQLTACYAEAPQVSGQQSGLRLAQQTVEKQDLPHDQASRDDQESTRPAEFTNSLGMKFRLIPAGDFLMGSPESDEMALANERPQHRVHISRDFYLGATEVTHAQFERVMSENWSQFRSAGTRPERVVGINTDDFPVEQVLWKDAVDFCKKLTDLPSEKEQRRVYRLPTEAEWEYACRAGSSERFCFGHDVSGLADYAWFEANSERRPHPVGQKLPNAWGLHDMHGNVFEWCHDVYGPFDPDPATDPTGATSEGPRVFRGGGWYYPPRFSRSADRCQGWPDVGFAFLGFRVAATVTAGPTENMPSGDEARLDTDQSASP